MKIESLLFSLEELRLSAESIQDDLDRDIVISELIDILVEHINHPKVKEAVNDIPF